MNELKVKVDEVVRLYKKYYKTGDRDLLPKGMELLGELKKINVKVYELLDDFTYLYITEINDKKIYHIIDYLCGTNLEEMESEQ